MCGRFSFYGRQRELAAFTGIPDVPELPLRYNIAPTQSVAAVRLDGTGERELVLLRWGLVPSWAKAVTGRAPINARADAVASRPMFRAAFRSRRCLIPASGFYEWKKVGKAKQPYLFRRRDERLVAFAGLWEEWEGGGGEGDLLWAHREEWTRLEKSLDTPLSYYCFEDHRALFRRLARAFREQALCRRGFVERVEMSLADYSAVAERLHAVTPLREVILRALRFPCSRCRALAGGGVQPGVFTRPASPSHR
jgi:hypothetical protein